MKSICLLIFCCLISRMHASGQINSPERRLKAVFVEALGNNVVQSQHGAYGIWSLNYDTRFQRKSTGWGARIGIGTQTTDGYSRYYRSYYAPVMLNKVTGHGRFLLETGVGTTLLMTYWYVNDQSGQQVPQHLFTQTLFGNLGLRIQPLRRGLFARICWTPTARPGGHIDYKNAGVSVGVAF